MPSSSASGGWPIAQRAPARAGLLLVTALVFALTLGRADAQQADGERAPGPWRYETARTRLAEAFSTGTTPVSIVVARELLVAVHEDDSLPAWYVSEIEGLVDGFERLMDLEPADRERLLEALASDPSPKENPELAQSELLRCRALLIEAMPKGHPAIARREFYLSNLALQRGEWKECETYARESLASAVAWRGAEGPETAVRMMWLGWVLSRLNRRDEARRVLEDAERIFTELRAPELGVYESSYMHLTNYRGQLAVSERRLDDAEALFVSYAEMARRIKGVESTTYLTALNNLQSCFSTRRDFARALEIQSECVAQAVRVLPPDDLSLARFYFNLGSVAQSAGRLVEARSAYERVGEIMGDSKLRPEVALYAQMQLAVVCLLLGDEQSSRSVAEQAIEDLQSQDYVAPDLRDGIFETAIYILLRTRSFQRATRALDDFEQSMPGLDPGRVAAYRAFALEGTGSPQQALEAWRASVRLRDPGDHSALLTAHTQMGGLLLDAGELSEASEQLEQAEVHFDADRARMMSGFGRTLSRTSPYPWIARAAFERGDAERFVRAIEAGSSRALAELLPRGPEGGDDFGAQLATLEQQAQLLRGAGAGTVDAAERLAEVESEILTRRRLRDADRAADLEPLTLAQLQAALGQDEAFVGWTDLEYAGGVGAVAWVLRAEGAPVLEAVEELDPYGYRRLLEAEAGSPFRPMAASVHGPAQELGQRMFGALLDRGALQGVRHLFVCTPGVDGLPLAALRVDGEWAGERWTMSYAPSCSLHVRLGAREPSTASAALLVADPTFGDGSPELPPLPATRAEAEVIGDALPAAERLLGGDAAEPRLLDLCLEGALLNYSVVHFATHAFVHPRDPSASRIALSQLGLSDPFQAALAGDEIFDGYLSVPEILARWRLDADLVTLSACQSALGANIRGEGFVGLTTAFLQAGARSVLASQWDVQDEPTQLFMGTFYGALGGAGDGRSKVRALREAQRALRSFERDGLRPFAHPAFWSSFILTGAP